MYSSANTIWVLVAAALVFFMQAGFAMVETGFTRAKNAGNIIMKNLMDFCIGTPIYWLFGFGLIQAGNQQVFAVCPQGDDIPPYHAGIAAVITGQPAEALPAFEGLLKIEGNSTGEPGGILCHSLSSCRFRRWVS